MNLESKLVPFVLAVVFSCELVGSIAITPNPRMKAYEWMSLSRWFTMHAEDVALAEKGEPKVVFWGDSITEGWNGNGRELWNRHFAPLGAVNFGIGGDMTQNLLWRLDNGSVGILKPDRIVLLIGTNNFGFTEESPASVAEGVYSVVAKLRAVHRDAEILLMAVFPRNQYPDHPNRAKIQELNDLIKPLDGREKITFLDIGDKFLLPDGTIDKDLMPDFLHLSAKGYEIWAEAVLSWMNQGQ